MNRQNGPKDKEGGSLTRSEKKKLEKKKQEKKKIIWSVILWTLLAAAVGYAVSILTYTVRIDDKVTFEQVSQLMTSLFFVAVLMERFVEIFMTIWRGEKHKAIQQTIESFEDDLKEEHVKLKAPTLTSKERKQILELTNRLEADIKNGRRDLTEHESKTTVLSLRASFAVGVIISLAGIKALNVLFDADALKGLQAIFFRTVDVIITGGLLAGGSKLINSVMKVFEDFMAATSEKAKARKTEARQEAVAGLK